VLSFDAEPNNLDISHNMKISLTTTLLGVSAALVNCQLSQ